MLFRDLAATFRRIQMKNSRDASIMELSSAFRTIRIDKPEQLSKAMYLVTSELAPTHKGVEIRFRDKAFAPVVKSAFSTGDIDQSLIFDTYKKTGDYGDAVESLLKDAMISLNSTHMEPLSILAVFNKLERMSEQTGKGSTQRKQEIAIDLLSRCTTTDEAMFLARILAHQNLRIGVGAKSVITALAHSFADDGIEKSTLQPWVASVAAAFSQRPIFEDLVSTLSSTENINSLDERTKFINDNATPKPGIPIQTMLGYPASSLDEINKRMKKYREAACEFKYDGARLQIHVESISEWKTSNTGLSIFSRNMEEIPVEHKYYQNVVQHILPFVASNIESFIIEGEMVAMDPISSALLPFQTLQTNENKEMCLFAFDCLYVNGTSLMHQPFRERRESLRTSFDENPKHFEFVDGRDIPILEDSDLISLQHVLQEAVDASCEGLMVKSLDEPYKAGSRTHTWLKVKMDYLPRVAANTNSGIFLPDTLDLVPIAAYHGQGRRAQVFGSFLLACYDPNTCRYQTVGKVGSGFSDVELSATTQRLEKTKLEMKPLEYMTNNLKSREPDVWFSPSEVWEIRAAQLTQSAQYTGGSVDGTKGLGLRFPRFVQVRADKSVDQATTSDQLVAFSTNCSNTSSTEDE